MVCALEYLQDVHGIFGWLKPRNVLLDSVGHVVLCGFGLFGAFGSSRSTPGYPAPEVLLGQDAGFKTADWWTLGVFLYEMLTGLPPFYNDNHEEIRRQILGNQPIPFPDSLSAVSRDLMAKLLDRRPDGRLGAHGGAAQIKAHPFFEGVDWHKILQRGHQPAFKPGKLGYVEESSFTQYGVTEPPAYGLFTGFRYNRPAPSRMPKPDSGGSMATKSDQPQVINEEKDGRKLVWEPVPSEFHIHDPATKTKESIRPRHTTDSGAGTELNAAASEISQGPDDYTVPSQRQKHDVLEAALQSGYDGIVAQLLKEHGEMDLNIIISAGDPLRPTRTSPLEFVTEQEKLGLVCLFLTQGADANYSGCGRHQGGPALVKAVEKGNQTLAALLVGTTGRVASTRALGLAVDRQDATMAALLLEKGVRGDFEVDDRPDLRHPGDTWQYAFEPSEPDELVPPLVRAVKHRNAHLVRLLLSHGADAKVGYHDLTVGDTPDFEECEDGSLL
jgi:serum/glucocorticoid-regulated kinase 2